MPVLLVLSKTGFYVYSILNPAISGQICYLHGKTAHLYIKIYV